MKNLDSTTEWEYTVQCWHRAMRMGLLFMTAKHYKKLLALRGYTGEVLEPMYRYEVFRGRLIWWRA